LSRLLEGQPASSAEVEASTETSVGEVGGALRKRWGWAGLAALALLIWKLKSVLAFVVTKGKFLLAGLTKSGTFFSMLLSFGVYWTAFGWKFAVGLIVSIYIHEMGHVAALHRFGIRASAPMFIPGLGAFVRLGQYPVDAREDARVGLAGPLWGLGAAVAAYLVFLASGAPSWGAIARVGAWINLFNLLPVWQLDGSRGFRALSRSQRFLVTAAMGTLWFLTGDGLLMLLAIAAAFRAWGGKAPEQGDRIALAQFLILVLALASMCLIQVPIG
jgi:Zn-dependent protease